MKKVLVTGAAGRVGRDVVRGLLHAGHGVVAVDIAWPERPDGNDPELTTATLDVTDRSGLAEVAQGCDAIVHLAGVPRPLPDTPELSFGTNVMAAFAAYQVAADLGIARVVAASSASALGRAWAERPEEPLYFPIDEAHPLRAADHYALAKGTVERIGQSFSRETGLTAIALRFPWVSIDETLLDRVALANAEPTGGVWFRDIWSYVRPGDLASAFVAAIAADAATTTVNIVAPDTLMETPTETLLRQYFPSVEIREPIIGNTPAWSFAHARNVLGFSPLTSWRDLQPLSVERVN